MRRPIYVRPCTAAEHQALDVGLHSADAFVLRRCQILLASGPEHQLLALGSAAEPILKQIKNLMCNSFLQIRARTWFV